MAKDKKSEDEQSKKEQDKARADEEERKKLEAEALQKKKEREKKQKLREKRQKLREEKERKRIKRIIDFPFKVVHNTSAIIALVYFLLQYFGNSMEILESLYTAFVVYLICEVGGCLLVFAIFFVISQKREKELRDLIKHNEEQIRLEEERKRKEEQELIETQKVMLETNDDNLEAKRQEEMKKFREMKENESRIRPAADRQSKPALDIEDQLSRLPDEFLDVRETPMMADEDEFPAANGMNGFGMNMNPDEDFDNPFITMPKK